MTELSLNSQAFLYSALCKYQKRTYLFSYDKCVINKYSLQLSVVFRQIHLWTRAEKKEKKITWHDLFGQTGNIWDRERGRHAEMAWARIKPRTLHVGMIYVLGILGRCTTLRWAFSWALLWGVCMFPPTLTWVSFAQNPQYKNIQNRSLMGENLGVAPGRHCYGWPQVLATIRGRTVGWEKGETFFSVESVCDVAWLINVSLSSRSIAQSTTIVFMFSVNTMLML